MSSDSIMVDCAGFGQNLILRSTAFRHPGAIGRAHPPEASLGIARWSSSSLQTAIPSASRSSPRWKRRVRRRSDGSREC